MLVRELGDKVTLVTEKSKLDTDHTKIENDQALLESPFERELLRRIYCVPVLLAKWLGTEISILYDTDH